MSDKYGRLRTGGDHWYLLPAGDECEAFEAALYEMRLLVWGSAEWDERCAAFDARFEAHRVDGWTGDLPVLMDGGASDAAQVARITALEAVLADLVTDDGGLEAGITSDEFGVRCIYCEFDDESFDVKVNHGDNCPIARGRALLSERANG